MRSWGKCFAIAFSILGGIALSACEKNIPEPGNLKGLRELTFEEKILIEQSNQLAFDFLSRLDRKEPQKNLFFSPLSVGMAMGMLYNGVDEIGKNNLGKITGFTGPETQINKTFNELAGLLKKADLDVRISLSNSLWYNRKYLMDDLFKDKIMAYYGADAEGLNFESTNSSNYINRVVGLKISKNLDEANYPLSGLDVLQINAVSFSGKWASSPEWIVKGKPFNGKTGVDFEFLKNTVVRLYEDNHKKIVEIPYGNGQYNLTVVMPQQTNNGYGMVDYMEFNHLMSQADTALYNIYVPMINTGYRFNLQDLWSKDELEIFFGEIRNSMFVGQAPDYFAMIQDAYLDPPNVQDVPLVFFNEFLPSERTHVLDKPFFYFIREKHTGIILFAGKFLHPESH